MLESNIDPQAWALEIERVAMRLKNTNKSFAAEWRNHLNQTREYQQAIEKFAN